LLERIAILWCCASLCCIRSLLLLYRMLSWEAILVLPVGGLKFIFNLLFVAKHILLKLFIINDSFAGFIQISFRLRLIDRAYLAQLIFFAVFVPLVVKVDLHLGRIIIFINGLIVTNWRRLVHFIVESVALACLALLLAAMGTLVHSN
jgi:hypothetical protein